MRMLQRYKIARTFVFGKKSSKWRGTLQNFLLGKSPFVIIFLTKVFEGIVLSKIILPFPLNPYLKTDVTSLLILFFVKGFKEKGVECTSGDL